MRDQDTREQTDHPPAGPLRKVVPDRWTRRKQIERTVRSNSAAVGVHGGLLVSHQQRVPPQSPASRRRPATPQPQRATRAALSRRPRWLRARSDGACPDTTPRRASIPVSPAHAPQSRRPPPCTALSRPSAVESRYGLGRTFQPKDAKGRQPLVPRRNRYRYRGRCVVGLYNETRPHSALAGRTPPKRTEISCAGTRKGGGKADMNMSWREQVTRVSGADVAHARWNFSTVSTGSFTPSPGPQPLCLPLFLTKQG